ncbi:MAG: hypothetical protein ACOZFS_04880 [Thermodesulfobacteriota bacterium]
MRFAPSHPSLTSESIKISRILRPDILQRQPSPETTGPAAEPETPDPILEGLKTMAQHLPPRLTDPIEEGLKSEGAAIWRNLSTGEKAILIGWGVAALGTALPPLMIDEGHREGVIDLLEGQNLAVLLRPIPYNPLKKLSFQRPTGEGDPLRFNATLSAAPVLDLLREENPWIPNIDVSFRFQLAVNPATFSPTLPEAGITIKGRF